MPDLLAPKGDDAASGSYKFEAILFSSIDSNLGAPLSLIHPGKHHHEARQSRDFKTSHRTSLHRSSSLVFRTLPPIRRMPSLQVPSLTDLTNPHNIPNPRSLDQIRETEATSFKLKLPLTLVHPNSPYVPWEPPVREKILCPLPVSASDSSTELDDPGSEAQPRAELQRDKKPLSSVWSALKLAPKKVKTKCQRLLNPRARDDADLAVASSYGENDPEDQLATYLPPTDSIPLSSAASFRSAETHSLAVWLSECQRKFLDRDCESSKLMTIDEYDRVGSWIKPGEYPFTASRTSHQYSFVSDHGDGVSSILVLESDGELASSPASPADHPPSSPVHRTTSPSSRPLFGPKRVAEEERLSRVVHRASVRSYLAERPVSNAWSSPSSP